MTSSHPVGRAEADCAVLSLDLALEYMSNQSLNFLAFRIESELHFMAQHSDKTVRDLTPEEREQLEELLVSK